MLKPDRFETHEKVSTYNLPGFLRSAWSGTEAYSGPAGAATLSQAVAHPDYAALYDLDGRILPESSLHVLPPNTPLAHQEKVRNSPEARRFVPERIDISDLERCSERIVFGGARHFHFGHHLLDGMSRLWFHSPEPTLYLDALTRGRAHLRFLAECIELGRPRQFFDLKKPTLFSNLVLPQAAVQNSFVIYGNADAEHLAITQSALARCSEAVPKKVYLSRRSVGKRGCEREDELEERLSREGFVIVRPESLSLVEQIAIFNFADWIVGPTGSAFHNLLFTRRNAPTRTVQLTPKEFNYRFLLVDRLKRTRSYYAHTLSWELGGGKVASTRVDVEKTLLFLRHIGSL